MINMSLFWIGNGRMAIHTMIGLWSWYDGFALIREQGRISSGSLIWSLTGNSLKTQGMRMSAIMLFREGCPVRWQ